ncbi:Clp protease N-terminal domain-containing protein [Streptomyces sp. NPDC127190]|uniref:Clp protease N-terminal domain-containing protein n=1 Tax=unclassified Streptomyces TaxID=2593676 RepID=UPI003634310F
MHSRIVGPTAPDEASPCPDDAAGLGAACAAIVAAARRRAVRDGDRQIDTAHLLHSLLEHDPEVRAAVGGPAQLARLFGYLVQRSIGYGLRWQGSVEDSGAIAVVARPDGSAGSDGSGGWSPVAAAALVEARARAHRRGEPRAAGTDLLAALIADPESRAVQVLERAGIPARELRTRLDRGVEAGADDQGAAC